MHEIWEKHKRLIIIVGVLIIAVIIFNNKDTSLTPFSSSQKNLVVDDFAPLGVLHDGAVGYDVEESFSRTAQAPSTAAGIVNTSLKGEIDTQDRIIKTAFLTLEVDGISSSVEVITNIAKREQGFVLNSNFSEDAMGNKFADITIRVPVSQFESVLSEIKEAAHFVSYESINGRDVTEEFVDLESRLVNLRSEEQQFQNILTRSGDIEDILAVTRELSRVRGDIEQLEGRKRYLENQTDLSTITLSLREESEVRVPSSKWRPFTVIKNSASQLVQSFQDFVDNTIRFFFWLISIIPYLVILYIIYRIGRRFLN